MAHFEVFQFTRSVRQFDFEKIRTQDKKIFYAALPPPPFNSVTTHFASSPLPEDTRTRTNNKIMLPAEEVRRKYLWSYLYSSKIVKSPHWIKEILDITF